MTYSKFPLRKNLEANFNYFPLSNKQGVEQPTVATLAFREVFTDQETQAAMYTDGSVRTISSTSTCGVYIPKQNLKCSWVIQLTSSIMTTELQAIQKSLILTWPREYEDITMPSYPKSAILAL